MSREKLQKALRENPDVVGSLAETLYMVIDELSDPDIEFEERGLIQFNACYLLDACLQASPSISREVKDFHRSIPRRNVADVVSVEGLEKVIAHLQVEEFYHEAQVITMVTSKAGLRTSWGYLHDSIVKFGEDKHDEAKDLLMQAEFGAKSIGALDAVAREYRIRGDDYERILLKRVVDMEPLTLVDELVLGNACYRLAEMTGESQYKMRMIKHASEFLMENADSEVLSKTLEVHRELGLDPIPLLENIEDRYLFVERSLHDAYVSAGKVAEAEELSAKIALLEKELYRKDILSDEISPRRKHELAEELFYEEEDFLPSRLMTQYSLYMDHTCFMTWNVKENKLLLHKVPHDEFEVSFDEEAFCFKLEPQQRSVNYKYFINEYEVVSALDTIPIFWIEDREEVYRVAEDWLNAYIDMGGQKLFADVYEKYKKFYH